MTPLPSTYCMKRCSSQKLSDSKPIFGYRLSRARRTTENGFGILSNRFRVLTSRMYLQPNSATKIKLPCCVLHNIWHTHSKNSYSLSGFADEVEGNGNIRQGEWREKQFCYATPSCNNIKTSTPQCWEDKRYFSRILLRYRPSLLAMQTRKLSISGNLI